MMSKQDTYPTYNLTISSYRKFVKPNKVYNVKRIMHSLAIAFSFALLESCKLKKLISTPANVTKI